MKNLLKTLAYKKEADKPMHQHFLLSTFGVHRLDSITPSIFTTEISRLWLIPVAEQSGSS